MYVTRVATGRRAHRPPAPWHSGPVTDLSTQPWYADHEWLTVPDLVERLGLPVGRVHRLVEDRVLLGGRASGTFVVPAAFLRDDEPLAELRGTLTVLADNGFTDDEALEWMLTEEESLGTFPTAALLAGRKAEVRRVAQSLL